MRARMDEDRLLVEGARRGNREAFDELVRRYRVSIVNLALAMTANDVNAEDLAQEVFVRAFRGLGRFRGDSLFKTWLYRIAVNVIRTHRARRVKQPESAQVFDETRNSSRSQTDDFESAFVRRRAIDQALATLPTDLRVAVTLRDVQGLNYREIADTTGVPIGTVESRIFRARQRLRPLLAPLVGGNADEQKATTRAVAGTRKQKREQPGREDLLRAAVTPWQ